MVSRSWVWRALSRRKVVDVAAASSSPSSSSSSLARVLTTFDLTALGVGSTLGVGVYVLAGSVAKDYAGPAVVISFAVAAVASLLAGLCYAEFGARVPLAGSAYVYSYVSIGEFMAFVIGWNLIMEYVIGCASVARGLSNYLDQLMNNVMQESFQHVLHLNIAFLSPYIDFFAFFVSFLLSVVLAFGVKESMSLNNLFTGVNMIIVLFVIVVGAFKADISNWQIDKTLLPADIHAGQGGFFPFGMMGVLRGAATCFYGFIGFDCIATTGEEVKNPQRAIPIAIIVSLLIIFLSYFGISAVLTLMWPYYLQDADAPLPYVFRQIGWPLAQWTVAIGGIFGLLASLFGAMYPLPRVIYAMANDGLIFRFLGEVHPKYKTPLVGTLLAGVITGIMAALFKLQQLVNMLSIGTLVAYTIVAACVLLLRYRYVVCEPADEDEDEAVSLLSDSERLSDDIYRCHDSDNMDMTDFKETTNLVSLKDKPTVSKLLAQMFNPRCLKSPTAVTSRLVSIEVLIFCGLSVLLGLCLVHMEYELMYGHWGPLSLVCVISSLLLIVLLSMALQPSSNRELAFKVPFVPVIPAVSITLNIYLILMLDLYTWIRFIIWMAVGVGVYFIALACRKMNWCGSSPVVHAPIQAPAILPTSTAPLCNGIGNKSGFSVADSQVLRLEEKLPQQFDLSKCSRSSIEINIQCATPVPSDISSGNDAACMPSVEESEQTSVVKAHGNCGASEHTQDVAVERIETIEFAREDSVGADSDDFDDNMSITEVTNDLLSLTYQIGFNTDGEKKYELFGNAPKEVDLHINAESFEDASRLTSNDIISVEDTETEDDVRSLYPDVVVISSSEEEINSRGSSIMGNECTDIGAGDHTEPVSLISLEENGMNPCNSPLKVATFSIFDSTENESKSSEDFTFSTRKNSFVAKLEKIIAQTANSVKVKQNYRPSLSKTLSLAEIANNASLKTSVMNVDNPNKSLSANSSISFGHLNAVSQLVPETNTTGVKLNEDTSQMDHSESGVDEVFSADSVRDIKAKLEKIFSAGISSPITSPISKSSPIQLPEPPVKTIASKELMNVNSAIPNPNEVSVEDVKSSTELKAEQDDSRQMDETRSRMASVLGTIRLKNPN